MPTPHDPGCPDRPRAGRPSRGPAHPPLAATRARVALAALQRIGGCLAQPAHAAGEAASPAGDDPRGCVEKLEARLAARITPAGRRLIERHGIRHPLGEILRDVTLQRGEVLFDELVGIYGTTPRTAAVRQQIVKNRPPPIRPW